MPSANVFITGANSGIGAALARHYAAAGATLGLFARREAALAALATTLPQGKVAIYAGDVRDRAALERAAADFVVRFGAPDVVIANAGISRGTVTGEREDLDDFAAVFDTNVLGIVHTFHAFLASMRERGDGTLVGIASVAGFRGLPGSGAYSASKAGGDHLSREPARRASRQRNRGRHRLSRLHRDADDRAQSVSDAVPDASGKGGAPHRARDCAAQALLRAAVADGARGRRAALPAAAAVRRGVRAGAAQAAPRRLSASHASDAGNETGPRTRGPGSLRRGRLQRHAKAQRHRPVVARALARGRGAIQRDRRPCRRRCSRRD